LKHILCYGDSNTWGFIAATEAQRYPFEVRIPGIIQAALGEGYRVIEESLNGRMTMFEDPVNPDRNGLKQLPVILVSHKPLDMITIMLGTNDMKSYMHLNAADSRFGVAATVDLIRNSDCGTANSGPKILVIAPPAIIDTPSGYAHLSDDAIKNSGEFARFYADVAKEKECLFLDAAAVVDTPRTDGVHIDEQGHLKLGQAMAEIIKAASMKNEL